MDTVPQEVLTQLVKSLDIASISSLRASKSLNKRASYVFEDNHHWFEEVEEMLGKQLTWDNKYDWLLIFKVLTSTIRPISWAESCNLEVMNIKKHGKSNKEIDLNIAISLNCMEIVEYIINDNDDLVTPESCYIAYKLGHIDILYVLYRAEAVPLADFTEFLYKQNEFDLILRLSEINWLVRETIPGSETVQPETFLRNARARNFHDSVLLNAAITSGYIKLASELIDLYVNIASFENNFAINNAEMAIFLLDNFILLEYFEHYILDTIVRFLPEKLTIVSTSGVRKVLLRIVDYLKNTADKHIVDDVLKVVIEEDKFEIVRATHHLIDMKTIKIYQGFAQSDEMYLLLFELRPKLVQIFIDEVDSATISSLSMAIKYPKIKSNTLVRNAAYKLVRRAIMKCPNYSKHMELISSGYVSLTRNNNELYRYALSFAFSDKFAEEIVKFYEERKNPLL